MSKGSRQSLCILGAINSGIVTVYRLYPGLAPKLLADIEKINQLVLKAFRGFDDHKGDDQKVLDFLVEWDESLLKSGLKDEINLTTMVAVSQQACQEILGKIRNKNKVRFVSDIIVELDSLAYLLQEGCSDKHIIPKFEKADLILDCLFEVIKFDKR